MSNEKQRGPAMGGITFNNWGTLRMHPHCHPTADYQLLWNPLGSKAGHMELRCADCTRLIAEIRVGKR